MCMFRTIQGLYHTKVKSPVGISLNHLQTLPSGCSRRSGSQLFRPILQEALPPAPNSLLLQHHQPEPLCLGPLQEPESLINSPKLKEALGRILVFELKNSDVWGQVPFNCRNPRRARSQSNCWQTTLVRIFYNPPKLI